MKNFSPERAVKFTESVIREMTRVCLTHQGVNLAQGFPDFPAPAEIKEAAVRAIRSDINQYAITWGAPNFRQAKTFLSRDFQSDILGISFWSPSEEIL